MCVCVFKLKNAVQLHSVIYLFLIRRRVGRRERKTVSELSTLKGTTTRNKETNKSKKQTKIQLKLKKHGTGKEYLTRLPVEFPRDDVKNRVGFNKVDICMMYICVWLLVDLATTRAGISPLADAPFQGHQKENNH